MSFSLFSNFILNEAEDDKKNKDDNPDEDLNTEQNDDEENPDDESDDPDPGDDGDLDNLDDDGDGDLDSPHDGDESDDDLGDDENTDSEMDDSTEGDEMNPPDDGTNKLKVSRLLHYYQSLYNTICSCIHSINKMEGINAEENAILKNSQSELEFTKNCMYDYMIFAFNKKSYEENLYKFYNFKSSVEITMEIIKKIAELRSEE